MALIFKDRISKAQQLMNLLAEPELAEIARLLGKGQVKDSDG
jgi:hypothetical protein